MESTHAVELRHGILQVMTDADRWSIAAAWVSALATYMAVIFALYIAHRDWRRADRDRRDAEAAQARLVTITSAQDGTHHNVTVQNHSTSPVFALVLFNVSLVGSQLDFATWEHLDGRRGYEEMAPPGSEYYFHIVLRDSSGVAIEARIRDHLMVTIRFMDAAGLYWQRTGVEQPRRVLFKLRRGRIVRQRVL